MIEQSRSGRAKCRDCREVISKDAWRYGEEEDSVSFDGAYVRWYHLECAVDRRPTGVSRDLSKMPDVMPRLEWGRHLCQAQINRCVRKRVNKVSRPIWVKLVDDGRAHVVCRLESGFHGVVTEIMGKWTLLVEGSLDDALATLPGELFKEAADALGRPS